MIAYRAISTHGKKLQREAGRRGHARSYRDATQRAAALGCLGPGFRDVEPFPDHSRERRAVLPLRPTLERVYRLIVRNLIQRTQRLPWQVQ